MLQSARSSPPTVSLPAQRMPPSLRRQADGQVAVDAQAASDP